ncbi:MAG: ABC transporter substrate-binding protein [Desulfobacteraceae bacterium]|nr:ABC transporter substrate-binding protein [Desulfobacteraceae bacterium]
MKKCILVLFLSIAMILGAGSAMATPDDTFVVANYGTVGTLDPAVCYDNEGYDRLWSLYETLIFFKGGETEQFVPLLATEVPTMKNGGISADGKTYTFTIRKGVKFHNGEEMTPEDVVYSIKRSMVVDQDGGPSWMLLEALTGEGGTRGDDGIIPGIFEKIDKSVEAKGDKVIFHLPNPYPPLMGILVNPLSSVVSKKWATANGCWDGDMANAAKFNNPEPGKEPLQGVENGTGPYKKKLWETSKQFIFERFDGYWGGKAKIQTAIVKYVPEWSTRKLMLKNKDADRVHVDQQYVPEVQAMKGVKIYEVPTLSITAALFCQKLETSGNPNIGSGKLDGEGIPPDFFADINVRKAFLHAFDRNTYKKDVFNDLAIMPSSPNIEGLPYHKDAKVYEYDLKKSAEYMKKAFGGQVWEKGFKMIITHNTGNDQRQAAAYMLAENIMSVNPKFQIDVRNVEWKDYWVVLRQYVYPIFIIGWFADYADPHNFMYTFMHSKGVYGRYMGVSNAEVDKLAVEGIQKANPDDRRKIYHRLQDLWYELALGVPVAQPIGIHAFQENVQGYVPNAMMTTHSHFVNFSK